MLTGDAKATGKEIHNEQGNTMKIYILAAIMALSPADRLTFPEYVTLHQAGHRNLGDFGQYAAGWTSEEMPRIAWVWRPFRSSSRDKTWYYQALETGSRVTISKEIKRSGYWQPMTETTTEITHLRFKPRIRPVISVPDPNAIKPIDDLWRDEPIRNMDPNSTDDPALKALFLRMNEDKT